jgi:hypothetical protein
MTLFLLYNYSEKRADSVKHLTWFRVNWTHVAEGRYTVSAEEINPCSVTVNPFTFLRKELPPVIVFVSDRNGCQILS